MYPVLGAFLLLSILAVFWDKWWSGLESESKLWGIFAAVVRCIFIQYTK
jgi:hypothetical protein